jgi:hypothetical protein
MKFLTIGTFKDAYYTIPRAERQKISISQYEYNVRVMKKMGDKLGFYTVPGYDRMLVFIIDVDSVEELGQFFAQAPVATTGFLKYESYPLIKADVKAMEAILASLKAAKK